MFTSIQRDGKQEGKVESVSEETRNMLARKERKKEKIKNDRKQAFIVLLETLLSLKASEYRKN